MRYHESLNIIFMRDNGPRRSVRIRRNYFYLLLIFFISLPFLCVLLGVQCWNLWEENQILRASIDRFESDATAAQARAERLENIEELAREENIVAREIYLRNLAQNDAPQPEEKDPLPETQEGPGHEEFPALDTGRVNVANVQARAMAGHRLRVALDLRNPENDQVLSGVVSAILITANGEKHELVFDPEDIGSFKINRFKRTVMVAKIPSRINLDNSEVIIEVRTENGEPIYRNIFAVHS